MKIKIDRKFYFHFDDIAINYKLDSIASTFSFKARFNHEKPEHKQLFRPLQYKLVEIFNDDDTREFTGYIINHSFTSNSVSNLVSLSGYSKPGILEDCSIPYSSYPLEKNNVSLRDVTEQLIKPFGINYDVFPSAEKDIDLVYEKTTANPGETVKSYLAKLAAQRNIILSHNPWGDIVFTKPGFTQKSKKFFNKNNTLSMSLGVNGQGLHSSISVIRQPGKEGTGINPVDTVNNPLIGINRSLVKVLTNGEETDTAKAANNILASELNNISITIEFNGLEEINCGNVIEVQNPEIFIYNRVRLAVSEVSIKENSKGSSTTLKCVLPESYTGNVPKNIFL